MALLTVEDQPRRFKLKNEYASFDPLWASATHSIKIFMTLVFPLSTEQMSWKPEQDHVLLPSAGFARVKEKHLEKPTFPNSRDSI
jgi:hypothetical protein